MKKLLTALMFSMSSFVIHSALPAPSANSKTPDKQLSGRDCAKLKFHNLNRYKAERWWRVFADREVAPALRTLLKRDYGKLKESLKEVSYPGDSLSYMDERGVLTFEGAVPGLFTIMEAKLIIEPCGNIYAAILDNGTRILYFTNDRKYIDKLPVAIDQWRAKIEEARSQSREVPQLPVVFKSK